MADFLYRKFRKMTSARSISSTIDRLDATIHPIAQQQDANLRDHYLHRMLQHKSY